MRTGGVYGFLAASPEQPRKPGEWQTYDITLVGRVVTVVQNGRTIIDKQEIPGITGGALDSHEALPGPIYLQVVKLATSLFGTSRLRQRGDLVSASASRRNHS
jgi:hypothetical protein